MVALDFRRHRRFLREPSLQIWIGAEIEQHDFQRAAAPSRGVNHLVYRTHAPGCDTANNLVAFNRF